MLTLCLAMGMKSQEVETIATLKDGTRVMTTTECRFAKGSGLFGRSHKMAMSHVTYGDDGSSTYTIVFPLNVKHRYNIPAGSRMLLKLRDGTMITLQNVLNIERKDNKEEYDHTFTVRPEYAISEEQLATLSQIEVTSIRLEMESQFIELSELEYSKEWNFNRMLQRCHNVLKWKLDELQYKEKGF